MTSSLFGTQFIKVLDAYRYVERSIKYGVLFFVLVFTTFFLFEITARQKIHPLQYLMVGAALCLFTSRFSPLPNSSASACPT